jgi:hypothetical protein
MGMDNEPFQIFADRKSLANRGAHKNEHGHLSFTESGGIESLLLDSALLCEDCGKEVRILLKGDVDRT